MLVIIQMRGFGLDVKNVARKCYDGLQLILTQEGHVIFLKIQNRLAYMDMRPQTKEALARVSSSNVHSRHTLGPKQGP